MADEISHLLASAEETIALGFALGETLEHPLLIGLVGEMGSGKTTFVRGLARGLGVQGPVNSPTYTLMQRYEGRMRLDHFDAWMEGRERDVLADGAHEMLGREGVSVVEWADRVEDWLPPERLMVSLEVSGVLERKAVMSWVGTESSGQTSNILDVLRAWSVPEPGETG